MADHRHTVLITDDDPPIRDLIAEVLASEGFDVLIAEHGGEAITLIDAHRQEICAILLDVMLPQVPWSAVLQHVQQTADEIPVIAMSASAQHLHEATQAGATLALRKPFNLDELLAIVTEHCRCP